jgi:AcrR family transcriptional regulator
MTVTETRKERQKMERERLIIEIAARLLSRYGFQDLNLDELAEAIEYSKGTLYLHFKTKEDLVLAVATQALKLRTALLERSNAWVGSTRDRARAMGFACCEFAMAHPVFSRWNSCSRRAPSGTGFPGSGRPSTSPKPGGSETFSSGWWKRPGAAALFPGEFLPGKSPSA